MVPFAVISAALGILNRRLGLQSSALFMVVMSASDVMTLNFFWMVKDEGSWLDIGTTISHFVIGSVLCVFVAGLEGVSQLLISGVEVDGDGGGFEGRVREIGGWERVGGEKVKGSDGHGHGHGNGKSVNGSIGDGRPVIE
jgi:phosphatidylinositol glycan class N